MNVDAIPLELRELPRWVVWRWGDINPKTGKREKPPYRADSPGDRHASNQNPADWTTFHEAVAVVDAGKADGIGFALCPPYVGVDLDSELSPAEREAIIFALVSYTEDSVSGTGAHVVLKASLNGGKHPTGFGVFQEKRFFYFSGEHWPETPTTIEERQGELDMVLAQYLPKPEPSPQLRTSTTVDLDDRELLEIALDDDKFRRLWRGDTTGYPSASQADQALANKLRFYFGQDPPRIDRMFRESGLMRDKWERDDYRERTIEKALPGAVYTRGEAAGRVLTRNVGPPLTPRIARDHLEAGHKVENLVPSEAENSFVSLGDRAPTNEMNPPRARLPFAPLEEALAATTEHVEWILHGCLAGSVKTLFASRPKTGKSTTTFGLLRSLINDQPFLGLDVRPSSVLLLSEEPAAALREKADRFGFDLSFVSDESPRPTNEYSGPRIHLLRRSQALGVAWPDILDQAIEYALERGIGVLVIDTLDKWAGFRGDDENKTGALLEVMEPIERAVAAGLAVLIITHHRKSGGEFGEGVRGGNALVGAVDVVLELDRLPQSVDESRHARTFRGISRFEDTPEEIVFRLDNNTFTVLGNVATVRAEADLEATVSAVRQIGTATAEDVAPILDLTKPTAHSRLEIAFKKGRLIRSGRGVKGDPYMFEVVA